MPNPIIFFAQSLGDRTFERAGTKYNAVLVEAAYKSPSNLSVASDDFIPGYDYTVSAPITNISEKIILTQEYLQVDKFRDYIIDGLVKTNASVITEGSESRDTTITAVGFKLIVRGEKQKDKVFYKGKYKFRTPLNSANTKMPVAASFEDHILKFEVKSTEHIIMRVDVYGYVNEGEEECEKCIVGILHPRGESDTMIALPMEQLFADKGIDDDVYNPDEDGVEFKGSEYTEKGNTGNEYADVLKWDCKRYERKTIHLENLDPTNCLNYIIVTRVYREGISYEEVAEVALVAGDIKQVFLNNTYAQVIVSVQSTTAGSSAKYRIDAIGLEPVR